MSGVKWFSIPENECYEKIIIVGTGPSLENFDFNKLSGLGYIIAVNDAHKFIQFANAWFTVDPWGLSGAQIPKKSFLGKMYAAVPPDFALPNASCYDHRINPPPTIRFLHRLPFHTNNNVTETDYLSWGLSEDKSCIKSGNSGYGALNLAYHYRPKKILLLGIDASIGYFFDVKKKTNPLYRLPELFKSAKPQLEKNNIEVINGSTISNIDCFQKLSPNEAVKVF